MDQRIRSTPRIATAGWAGYRPVRVVVGRAVPALADFAMVFLVAGRSIVGIASVHTSPAGDRLLRALRRIYRIRRDDLHSAVAHVIRTGRPLLRRRIQHDGQLTRRGSIADLHRKLACRSALVMPIRIGAMVAGAVTLCYAGSGRTYAPADVAGAQRLAQAVAQSVPPAVSNATASRLRPPTGDARRHTAVRRRMAARN